MNAAIPFDSVCQGAREEGKEGKGGERGGPGGAKPFRLRRTPPPLLFPCENDALFEQERGTESLRGTRGERGCRRQCALYALPALPEAGPMRVAEQSSVARAGPEKTAAGMSDVQSEGTHTHTHTQRTHTHVLGSRQRAGARRGIAPHRGPGRHESREPFNSPRQQHATARRAPPPRQHLVPVSSAGRLEGRGESKTRRAGRRA